MWDNEIGTVEIETVGIEMVVTSQSSQPQQKQFNLSRLLQNQDLKLMTAND
jgi:hypothetical protein